jgi:integrase
MRHLRLDQHFFQLKFADQEHVVIRIGADQTKNRARLDHFLTEDATWLLSIYVEQFLPILTRHNPSPYLFPGQSGKPKAAQSFRQQTSRFVNRETKLGFQLHAIRKIAAKLYLDKKPEGLRVIADVIGDSENTTRRVYAIGARRAAAKAYVTALEESRLHSFKPVRQKLVRSA